MKNVSNSASKPRRGRRNIALGRPRGSVDRHGRCNRVDLVSLRRTTWRSFAVAFGQRLGDLLKERDVAASELAAAVDVSVMTVLAWRRGRSVPLPLRLAAVSRVLSCSLVDLLPDQAHAAGGVR